MFIHVSLIQWLLSSYLSVHALLQVTDHEVECDPKFRLFLHTTGEPQTIPHYLAAYTSVLYFQQNRQCVEEELLDIFMAHEKARLENESTALRQVGRLLVFMVMLHVAAYKKYLFQCAAF